MSGPQDLLDVRRFEGNLAALVSRGGEAAACGTSKFYRGSVCRAQAEEHLVRRRADGGAVVWLGVRMRVGVCWWMGVVAQQWDEAAVQ